MTDDQHLTGWGKVAGNLLAVEQVMRIFLCEATGEKLEYPVAGQADVALTHLTSRDSLGDVITKFNRELQPAEANFTVDRIIVQIRDAIAHGRLTALTTSFPVTLYKFGREHAGRVAIESADVLDENWFEEKRSLLHQQIDKVISCSRARGFKFLL